MEENYTNTEIVSTNKKGVFEKISFIVLFIVSFIIPVFFMPLSFISTQFGSSLLFGFGVVLSTLVMIVSTLISGTIELPKPKKYIIGSMALVPVVYILAGIANGFSRMSFLGYTFDISTAGFVILSFLFLFLVSTLFKNEKRIFYSYIAFVASSLILFLFVVARMIFGVKFLSFGMFNELTSTMVGNWNNVGIFFGIGAILSLITYQMLNISRFLKVVLTVALLASLFFLALVNFGTVWIIVAVCSLLFVLYGVFNKEQHDIAPSSLKDKILRIPLYPTIVLIISVIFVIWGSTLGAFLSNKFNVTNLDVRPSFSVTVDIARNTLKSQPLFGSGPNSFVTQWLSYKPNDIVNTVFWNTDFTYGIGLIPTFAVTTGIIGLLSWIIFLGFYLYLGMKSLFTKYEDSFLKYLVASSFFVSLYLWIMACVYVPSVVVFVLTFFFTGLFFASTYLAHVVETYSYKFSNSPRSGFLSSFILVVLFIGVGSLGYGLFRNSESLWYFQKSSYTLNATGDITLAETYMLKAIGVVPYDVYYRSLSEIELYKLNAVLSQDPKKVKVEDIQKQSNTVLSDAITAGLNARNVDPINYLNWVALGRVYESAVPMKIEGAYNSAQFSYSEALRRNPQNPGIYLMFARLEVANGDLKKAKTYALSAIQAKQNYLDAYFLLSQIEVADKNLKGAIDSVTVASVINPNDPSIFFQLGLLKYNDLDFKGAIESLQKSLTLSPDYANAKYFLGLSYEITKEHEKAIAQFEDLKKTNPDNAEVTTILEKLKAGKQIFTTEEAKPETRSALPVKETQ